MFFKIPSEEEIVQKNKEMKLNFTLEKFGYNWNQLNQMSYDEKRKIASEKVSNLINKGVL